MLSILVLMELKVYFENKYVLLTDCKSTQKNENSYICKDISDIQRGIASVQGGACDSAILYGEDFNNLLKLFKSNFKYIEAAGGFIKNEFDEYLFIYRREKWDLPKGKLELGETPEIAAVREVQEETGLLKVERKKYRCSTWHTYELRGEQVLKQTYWYDMEATKNQDSKPQTEEEITELQWLKKSEFSKVLSNTFPSIVSVIECE